MAKSKKVTKTTKKGAVARKVTRKPARKAASKSTYDTVASQMRTITPYLGVGDAMGAIEWYKKALGAKVVGEVMPAPGGKVMHATMKFGDSLFFLSDIFPGSDLVDPSRAGASVNLNVFHKDCDKIWDRLVANGAKVTMPLDDMFWGDRYGKVLDPFGHSWAISRKSKLSAKELAIKREEAMKQFATAPNPA